MADFDNRLDREDGIRTMDALTELRNKNFLEKDDIERVICEFWEDTSGLEWLAERAATELAALRERAEKAEAERDALKEFANNILETMELHSSHWEYHLRRNLQELEATLKGDA